jgi:hypothetical protein
MGDGHSRMLMPLYSMTSTADVYKYQLFPALSYVSYSHSSSKQNFILQANKKLITENTSHPPKQLPFAMADTVAVTTTYEVSQPEKGQYVVKQVVEEQQPELNSGNRKEISFDVKFFSVCNITVRLLECNTC